MYETADSYIDRGVRVTNMFFQLAFTMGIFMAGSVHYSIAPLG